MRKELRRPFLMYNTGRAGEASSAHATRGAPGASMMDPTAAEWPGSRSSPFRMQKDSGSPAAAPPDGKFPMRPKRVRRACRNSGGGAGEGRPADQMDRMEGRGDRPDAIVRGSGSLRACGARVTHAICKRCLRYIPTQIFSTAAYLLQLFYCSYIPTQNMLMQIYSYAAILRRYSLLQLYSTVDITAAAAILTSHAYNVLPTHLIPSSLKVSHRSSSLPP